MKLFESVTESKLHNFFVVRNDTAIDLGSDRPERLMSLASTKNKFAIKEGQANRVTIFDGSEADAIMRSKAFANNSRDKTIILGKLIGRIPSGQIYQGVTGFRFTEEENNGYLSGGHEHPHASDGIHRHNLTLEGGGHFHAEDAQLTSGLGGGHFHRQSDPIEGFHLNLSGDDGSHQHILALSLGNPAIGEWFNQVINAHFPVHKWLFGHKKTFILHIGRDPRPFEASRDNWVDHFLWNHSAGMHSFRHDKIFIDPATQYIRKWYEFEDGTVRLATLDDFQAEEMWFAENLPFPEALFE